MSPETLLTTSPMMFAYPGREGRLTGLDARSGRRFRLSGQRAAQIVHAFLEPRTPADAEGDGFEAAELEAAVAAGLLVAERDAAPAAEWENNLWSRAAFLLFSQMDLEYAEFERPDRPPVEARRERVAADRDDELQPDFGPIASGQVVALPAPAEVDVQLTALTERRSVRSFAAEPPAMATMAGVLHKATEGMRVMRTERQRPDPLRQLNSYYSALHLFVVVQDVADVAPGVYEYDAIEHRLIEAAPAPADEDLAASVNGQRWILGAGFVVYVVADMCVFAWLYRLSRAYLHLLTQVGALGQELLTAATALGLGGWTSPAVHESRCAALLGLPDRDGLDALSIVKLGPPSR